MNLIVNTLVLTPFTHLQEESKQMIAATESRKKSTDKPNKPLSPPMIYAKPASAVINRGGTKEDSSDMNMPINLNNNNDDNINDSIHAIEKSTGPSSMVASTVANEGDLNNDDIMREIQAKLDPVLGTAVSC